MQGITSQVWAVFMYFTLFINLNEQIMPMFVPQRSLYEARERPSKIYRWSSKSPKKLVDYRWRYLLITRSLRAIKHSGRTSLELFNGSHIVFLHLLSYWL
jgi:hypothetical protein